MSIAPSLTPALTAARSLAEIGLAVREARHELVERALGRHHHRRLAQLPQRRHLDQVGGDLADALLEAGLSRLPGNTAQPIELHAPSAEP